MKKYIVTGGAGFIGSALVRGLLALEDGTVEVIDNLSTGRELNLTEVESRITFHRVDIRDFDAVRSAAGNQDVIVHLACIIPPASNSNPRLAKDVNVNGTATLIKAASAMNRPPRIISVAIEKRPAVVSRARCAARPCCWPRRPRS